MDSNLPQAAQQRAKKRAPVIDAQQRKKRTLAKTGHTEVVDPAVEATCTEPGKTEGKHLPVWQ